MTRIKWFLLAFILVFLLTGCDILPFLTRIPRHFPEAQETTTALPEQPEMIATATLVPTIAESPTERIQPTASLVVEAPSLTETGFTLQEGNPFYLPNFAHPEAGCQWLGVAGQVFDAVDDEILDFTLLVGDAENPDDEPMIGITGTALAYGRGGYEIQLGEVDLDSNNRFWIQVYSPDGIPLTEQVYFTTYEDCDRNLVLVNFMAVDDGSATKSSMDPTPTQAPYP